ncbi:MAG TPA: sigma-70 family RNA polymerase sigma factor, partial [Armatimonadota bacterium]|nr:sigma-70 family RNA polymerase sigma factor [Armatimonadota bacterium]
ELSLEEVLRELPAAIARLPLRQRQVVIWRYYEGRSFEDIAEVLEIRPATARSILRHGLNNLRSRFAKAGVQLA